ncbi:MAG: hypothetical protein GY753_09885 [Gammaproteobacteria bacterium]|nr:hypothetical protein [Gammaproteobacteria bacterium]
MNANAKKAFNELRKIGAPALDSDWGGHFPISAEPYGHDDGFYKGAKDCDPNGMDWANYYNQGYGLFGVSPYITEILDKYGLFAEWVNPGVLAVYDS